MREKLPIEVVDVPEMARSPLGHPQAVTVGDYVLLAGQMATDYETGVVPHLGQTLPDAPYWHVRMEHQAEHVIASARTLLEAAGSSLDRCVKVTSFHTDLRELPSSMAVRTRHFRAPGVPASTAVGIADLPIVDAGFQFETIGWRTAGGELERVDAMPGLPTLDVDSRRVFSPAVRAGDLIFTQGWVAGDGSQGDMRPIDPGLPNYDSAIRRETVQVLRQLGALLEAAGGSLETVVKADVYLADGADYPGLDEAFREVFPDSPPARSVTVVRELVVRGARTEICLTGLAADGRTKRQVIEVPDAAPPLGHEAQAIRADPFVFLSTQIARRRHDPREADQPHLSTGAAEAQEVAANAARLLEAAGSSLSRLVRLKAFHTDLGDLRATYRAWERAIGGQMPVFTAMSAARTTALHGRTCSFDLIAAA